MAHNETAVGGGLLLGWQPRTWQTVALVALGLLVLTNLAWLQSGRAEPDGGHTGLPAGPMPAPERVIYEYGKPADVAVEPPPLVDATPTPLRPGERCAGGQIIRRLPNGWEGLGQRCTP